MNEPPGAHAWPPLPTADRARFSFWVGGIGLVGSFIAGLGVWAFFVGGIAGIGAYAASRWL